MAHNVDFTTIIPQSIEQEIDTGIIYGGNTVYAQRFSGTVTLQANKRVEKILKTFTEAPYVLNTFGWTKAGVGTTANSSAFGVYSTDGPTFNGNFMIVGSPLDYTLRIRWTYVANTTGAYDVVIFYIKEG